MSRINDALNQARQAQPRPPGTGLTPLHPAAGEDRTSPLLWIIPSVIIFLIIAAIFFISWASAHRTINAIVGDVEISTNRVALPPVEPVAPSAPPPVAPTPVAETDELPVLQGIFYSTRSPSAIINNKNVVPGDHLKQYVIKAITKSSVILTAPDGKEVTLGLNAVH